MSRLSLSKRLARYEKALFFYRLSLFLPKRWFNTTSGFCYHFRDNGDYSLMYDFPELYAFKPEVSFENRAFWYPEGEIKPRIEHLKLTITYTKELLC